MSEHYRHPGGIYDDESEPGCLVLLIAGFLFLFLVAGIVSILIVASLSS